MKAGRIPLPCVVVTALTVIALSAGGCSRAENTPDATTSNPAATGTEASGQAATARDDAALPDVRSPYEDLPEEARIVLDRPFTGDFDDMVKRRIIRAGVAYNRTDYFIDKGVQRGAVYDSLRLFEDEVNKRLKTGNLRVHVAFVPLPRDLLLPALVEGKVDVAVAKLTVTDARKQVVDFSNPTRKGVNEIVVTGPGAPTLSSVEDLSGKEVFVRKTSSYYESLMALNARLEASGKAPVVVRPAPESFEDDDILEMVNAGLIKTTVVDDYLVEFWQQIFPNLTLQAGIVLREGGQIAVAVRKNNPRLKQAANIWIKEYGPRTAFGNMMDKRYLQDTKYVRSATSEAERQRFLNLVSLFRKYSDQYELDYLLMTAQAYQESGLDHNARSRVGAIGIMQLMPATGKELKVGDIRQLEPNIHAGVKYIRFMMDQYFKDEPMDRLNKGLMTFAAYNAGPGRIRGLRREAGKRGLDPNLWFGNVERVASERIGRETVQYVSNIYKYYVAYKLVEEQAERRQEAKARVGTSEE